MNTVIEKRLVQVAEICERFKVRRLELYGSALGELFDPEKSDVDLIVSFLEGNDERLLPDRYFDLIDALSEAFGRPVSMIMDQLIRNRYLKQSIDATRETIYESAIAQTTR
jgi:predicted nucleotidyltransferase